MRWIVWCAAAIAGATALPASAGAHGEGTMTQAAVEAQFRAQLDEVPRIAGLIVKVLDGPVPAIFVRNSTGELLEVRGRRGAAVLRIGPDGVAANAPRTGRPRWKRLSTVPVWAWVEHRARSPHWTIPMTLGGEALRLHGRGERVSAGPASSPAGEISRAVAAIAERVVRLYGRVARFRR